VAQRCCPETMALGQLRPLVLVPSEARSSVSQNNKLLRSKSKSLLKST
jgi:hypothetical protein